MSKVLVTGAKGMLGQDLCPILYEAGYQVYPTDKDNLSVTSAEMVKQVFEGIKPDIVIHCAAYTNVDKAEDEGYNDAIRINVTGTENIAKACEKINATLVYISTDYVFKGDLNRPYTPEDAPNPQNQYGYTKWEGEMAVMRHCSQYYIVRTSWLYGIHGKNFVETMISLADKSEIKVVDDQKGCPTWTVDLSKGIVELLKNKKTGIYHVCGGGSTTWYGFAKEIFERAGINVNLIPCATNESPRPAVRPKYSVMDNDSICRDWKFALSDYLELRGEK